MNNIVRMTGPHLGAVTNGRTSRPAWKVAIISCQDRVPTSKVYQCLSYRRAVALSCNMAHDRKLHLHLEALPR
ncbi:MAG: hypothetical protein K1X78_19030 [Verrucomicrobiaceae bacterium]|nr:hypothetical protein [Verrucomicrobiaceae bacterium]